MYGSETIVWKGRESSKMRAVQMDNLRAIIGLRKTGRMKTKKIRELVDVRKIDKVINDNIRWYRHMKIINENRMAKCV